MKQKVFERWLIAKDVKPNWSGKCRLLKVEESITKGGEPWSIFHLVYDGEVYKCSSWALKAKTKDDIEINIGDWLEVYRLPGLSTAFVYQRLPNIEEASV